MTPSETVVTPPLDKSHVLADLQDLDRFQLTHTASQLTQLPEELRTDPDVVAAAQINALHALDTGHIQAFEPFDEIFHLKDQIDAQDLRDHLYQAMNSAIETRSLNFLADELHAAIRIGALDIQDIRVNQQLSNALRKRLEDAPFANMDQIELFNYIDTLTRVANILPIEPSILTYDQLQTAARERFHHFLMIPSQRGEDALKISQVFGFSPQEINESLLATVDTMLLTGETAQIMFLNNYFPVKKIIEQNTNIRDQIVSSALKNIGEGSYLYGQHLIDTFDMSTHIDSKHLAQAALMGTKAVLKKGDFIGAKTMTEKFKVAAEELKQMAAQEFDLLLRQGYFNRCVELNTVILHYSAEYIFDMLKPGLDPIIPYLEKNLPQLLRQAQRSVDVLMDLYANRDKIVHVGDYFDYFPYLKDVLEANPRYGVKLLLKFPEFDATSQYKLYLLNQMASKIHQAQPAIEQDSPQFRHAIQQELLILGRNRDIVAEITRKGINIEKWLNYDNRAAFSLNDTEELTSLTKALERPISRLGQFVRDYTSQLPEILKEYQSQFDNSFVPFDDSQKQKIAIQLQTIDEKIQAAQAGQPGFNLEQLQKARANLQSQLDNPEKISVWNEIQAQLKKIQTVGISLGDVQTAMAKLEAEIGASRSSPATISANAVQNKKSQLNRERDELRKRSLNFQTLFSEFQKRLPILLQTALGDDPTVALERKIEETFAEALSDYNSDITTLKELTAGNLNKTKEDLRYHDMSIGLWNRNPDIDLYLGDYTSCCISIEGKIHEGVSPIIDFITDLGIQVLVITDETTGEPVTAAWMWLGENQSGETALVLDNIESNTRYSTSYPDLLYEKIKDFSLKLAREINVRQVVLGTSNNDLPQAQVLNVYKDADERFNKIGGSNFRDNYYLEAENEAVKLIVEST